jgi:hypothetical protein
MPIKKKKVKNVMVKRVVNHDIIQINLKKKLDEDKKIQPEKLFEGYSKSKAKPLKKQKKK